MEILFSTFPAPGHLLPLLPLADAAAAAGHGTAVMTGPDLAHFVAPHPLLAIEPPLEGLVAELTGRGISLLEEGPGAGAVELFAGVRIDLCLDQALERAAAFAPDLVVSDEVDVVGSAVAASLGVPWVTHAVTSPFPVEFRRALEARAAAAVAGRCAVPGPAVAHLDLFPAELLEPREASGPRRLVIRPVANTHGGSGAGVDLGGQRPRALVTVGTSVAPFFPHALGAMVASTAAQGLDVVATAGAEELPDGLDRDLLDRVHLVGFTPLAQVLPEVDVVVTAGGTGTLLSAAAAGVPVVICPFIADQRWNGEHAAAAGLAVVVDDPADVGPAARRVLDDPGYRRAAQRVSASIATMPGPGEALEHLLAAVDLAPGGAAA